MNQKQLELQSAVLAYLHALQPFSRNFSSIQDLRDGIIFSDLIFLLSDQKVQGMCNEPNSFSLVLSNLKSISNSLEKFHIFVLKDNFNKENFDLIQIAKNNNRSHIINLFLAYLGTAVQSPKKEFFIEKILTLPEDCQACFVDILRHVIESRKQESPKREVSVQNRLLQKLEQLEEQNEKLQKIIRQLFDEKQELHKKVKTLDQQLNNHEIQNQKLQEIIKEYSAIENSKQKDSEKEKYQALIENLKKKLIEITKENQVEKYKVKEIQNSYSTRLQLLQEQNDLYKQKYDECKESLDKFDALEDDLKHQRKLIEEKDQNIKKLKDKLDQSTDKLYDYEQKSIYTRMEIEKKNTRIEQLQREIQNLKVKDTPQIAPLKFTSKSLSQMCPQLQLGEVQSLKQQNQFLLKDLQRSTKRIRSIERQLEKYKKQNQKISSLESENKKLEEILMQYSMSRGEENQILIGCLFELRLKYKELQQQKMCQKNVLRVQPTNRPIQKKLIS